VIPRHCPNKPGLDASDRAPALNTIYHTGMPGVLQREHPALFSLFVILIVMVSSSLLPQLECFFLE
jgi:hypothetical protein